MIREYLSLDVKQNDVYKIIHEKKWNPHFMKPLDSTISLQEIWRKNNMLNDTTSKQLTKSRFRMFYRNNDPGIILKRGRVGKVTDF